MDQSRGERLEGWAFTFCKAAFLALIFQHFTLLATAAIACALYVASAASGVREWRCWVKPPWVTIAMGLIAAWQAYVLFFARG